MMKVDLCETILSLKCALSYAALGLCLEVLLFVACFFEKFVCLKSFVLEKQSRKCHVFKEFPAYKELPGKLNDDVIVDANVCV